jgi:hypothetical protein
MLGQGVILSSSEGLDIARDIQSELLRIGIQTLLWDQGDRRGMLLLSLISEIETKYQFAIFLLTPDDEINCRGVKNKVPRDNVIMELGLWLGRAGMERTFIIQPRWTDLKLPTDLGGLLMDPYIPNIPPREAFGNICQSIKDHLSALDEKGRKESCFEILPYNAHDPAKRNLYSKERIQSAVKGETVKFIAITGKGIICPDSRPGEVNAFHEALKKGVIFNGILLDPRSEQAIIRSAIETADTPLRERLLMRDAEDVRKWLCGRHRQDNIDLNILRNSEFKYCSLPLSFSLWLFSDFALVEPYHYGKITGTHHLCGFSLMKIGKDTYEFDALEKHFELLWSRSKNIS